MALDPKVKKFWVFIVVNLITPGLVITALVRYFEVTDVVWLVGFAALLIVAWRICLSIYRRLLQPTKHPKELGKWTIITGTTSGIGKEFAAHLARQGVSLLIISRSESKLQAQAEELRELHRQYHEKSPDEAAPEVRIVSFDFSSAPGSAEKREFYGKQLPATLRELHDDGGIGVLINNVGTANEAPKWLLEFDDQEIAAMINTNCFSVVDMSKAVLPFMKERKSGSIISISSGSGNYPGPLIQLYSATKAFMTQFTRSMKVECWDTGVDFYCVTPFYVVSNLYKRKKGTIVAPMPIKLVEGTLQQICKKYVIQGHGYWMHGFIGNFMHIYYRAVVRQYETMLDNRKRWEKRQQQQQQQPTDGATTASALSSKKQA